MGLKSEIYVDNAHPEVAGMCHPFRSYKPSGKALLIYQMSTGSEIAGFFGRVSEPLALNYHNITPAESFDAWEPGVADEMSQGRRELAKLCTVAVHGIADSSFNEAELLSAGCPSSSVAPILFDPASFDREADKPTLDWLHHCKEKGAINLLFVGRVSPNKAQHDLILALAAYREMYGIPARLSIVGGAASGAYYLALRRLVTKLGLNDAVDMPGSVSAEELSAYYAGSDIFVCASEHEGFCVPLLEAMYHSLPIIAFESTAVPETLAGSGLLIRDKRPISFAAAIHQVATNPALGMALAKRGESRLRQFAPGKTRAIFQAAVEKAIAAS